MTTVITNIKQLVGLRQENKLLRGKELAELPTLENAYLVIEDGIIAAYDKMENLKFEIRNPRSVIDTSGQFILPCWCDSHTHLVFAASREVLK